MRPSCSNLVLLLGFATLLSALSAHAQTSWSKGTSDTGEKPRVAIIHLDDESVVRGTIVLLDDDYVVLQNATLGKLRIPRHSVRSIEYPDESTEVEARDIWRSTDPDFNTVLLGPTPETLPKKMAYFRNFELFILNFGYALTDDLNLSFGMLFPISADVQLFSLGFKYRVVSREEFPVGFAVAANGSALNDETFATLSGILGVGNRNVGLNVSVHQPFVENTNDEPAFFIVSGDVQFAPSMKFLAEYGNSARAVLSDEDFSGFLNIGFRIFGERSSFTLTGFRPLEVDGDGFIAFPLAMYSRMW